MATRTVVNGETSEYEKLDGDSHCFIIRLGDDQFEALKKYQERLQRTLRRKVSRAAAAREALAHILPKRRRAPPVNQLMLFGKPLARNPLVAVEAQRVCDRAAAKLIGR